jgi:hypothetical protein
MAEDRFPARGVRYVAVSQEDFMMDLGETVSSLKRFV